MNQEVEAVKRAEQATELSTTDRGSTHSVEVWRKLREKLEVRHEARRAPRRFRRDPAAYLAKLEDSLLHTGLPQ